jgi:hypothetical protein
VEGPGSSSIGSAMMRDCNLRGLCVGGSCTLLLTATARCLSAAGRWCWKGVSERGRNRCQRQYRSRTSYSQVPGTSASAPRIDPERDAQREAEAIEHIMGRNG